MGSFVIVGFAFISGLVTVPSWTTKVKRVIKLIDVTGYASCDGKYPFF